MKLSLAVSAFLLFAFSSGVLANPLQGDWRLSLEVDYHTLSPEVRAGEGLGNAAGGVDFAASYYVAPLFAVKLGFGFGGVQDDDSYALSLTSNFGDTETFGTSVGWSTFFTEAFYQSPERSSGFGYRGGLGYTLIPNTERTIDICGNCPTETISIDGGTFLSASGFHESRFGKFGVSFRQYLSGDVQNGTMLWWEMPTRR